MTMYSWKETEELGQRNIGIFEFDRIEDADTFLEQMPIYAEHYNIIEKGKIIKTSEKK